LIGRFTLDSATEFLFGSSVHTLEAGLPYPYNVVPPLSSTSSTAATSLAQNFIKAFLEAQEAISNRERFASISPLMEIWKDKTEEPMKVLNAFIQPIINEAVAKRNSVKDLDKKVNADEIEENETMLDHLVKLTDGKARCSSLSLLNHYIDPVILKDAMYVRSILDKLVDF
jgi:hypothetical protein